MEMGDTAKLGVLDPRLVAPTGSIANISTKSRVIVVFDRILHPSGDVTLLEEPCGVVPFSEENRRLVLRGVSEDRLVHLTENPTSEWPFPPVPTDTPSGHD
jgi:hypothetical protein